MIDHAEELREMWTEGWDSANGFGKIMMILFSPVFLWFGLWIIVICQSGPWMAESFLWLLGKMKK